MAEAEILCEREWRLIINTVAAGALCAVGLVGNGASYRVLGRDTEILPVPRFLLRSLAVADNAFLLVWFANFSLWDLVVVVVGPRRRCRNSRDLLVVVVGLDFVVVVGTRGTSSLWNLVVAVGPRRLRRTGAHVHWSQGGLEVCPPGCLSSGFRRSDGDDLVDGAGCGQQVPGCVLASQGRRILLT